MEMKESVVGLPASSASIRKSDVPEYLQAGEFYKSLGDDDQEETICVPSDTLKPTLDASTEEELIHLLTSLRF